MDFSQYKIDARIIALGKYVIACCSFLFVAIPVIQALVSFKHERQDKRFEQYHKLLDELVKGENGITYVDKQIAVIYELRRFKHYWPITTKILHELNSHWIKRNDVDGIIRVLEEIHETLKYIKDHSKK